MKTPPAVRFKVKDFACSLSVGPRSKGCQPILLLPPPVAAAVCCVAVFTGEIVECILATRVESKSRISAPSEAILQKCRLTPFSRARRNPRGSLKVMLA